MRSFLALLVFTVGGFVVADEGEQSARPMNRKDTVKEQGRPMSKQDVYYNMLISLQAGLASAERILPSIEEQVMKHAHDKNQKTFRSIQANFKTTRKLIRDLRVRAADKPKNIEELKGWIQVLTIINNSLTTIQQGLKAL